LTLLAGLAENSVFSSGIWLIPEDHSEKAAEDFTDYGVGDIRTSPL
jgi:hypothetical protein